MAISLKGFLKKIITVVFQPPGAFWVDIANFLGLNINADYTVNRIINNLADPGFFCDELVCIR